MDVDVLAGSTVPMDRESMLEVMEKLAPFLQLAGVTPGSPAAKAYFREFIRLIGIMSVESIMDQIEEQPQIPPPKIMETQAKIQGKMAETKMKIQGKAQEEAIKIQALKEKLHVDRVKNEMQMQKGIMDSILKQFRQPVNGGFQNGGQKSSKIKKKEGSIWKENISSRVSHSDSGRYVFVVSRHTHKRKHKYTRRPLAEKT